MHSSISKKECTCDRLPEPFQMQFKTDVNVIVDICVFLIVLILPLYTIKLPGKKYDTLTHINESKYSKTRKIEVHKYLFEIFILFC